MTRRTSGIKQKVLWLAILPAASVTLLLTLFTSISQIRELDRSLNDRGMVMIRQLSSASEYGVFSGNPDLLQPLVDAIMKEPDVKAVLISNARKQIIISSAESLHAQPDNEFNSLAPVSFSANDNRSQIFQSAILQSEFPGELLLDDTDSSTLHQDNAHKVLGWVSVELSKTRTIAYQREMLIKTIIIAFTVLFLSGILAIRLGRGISNPVVMLNKAVQSIENGNLDIQLQSANTAELQTLSDGIHSMASTLKASHAEMEKRVANATLELRTALSALEARNQEIDSARREAESAIKAKSAFLANISHEVRTPLNGISGFLSLLNKTSLTKEQVEFVAKIELSTQKLLALISDILDFSKLEVSRIKINKAEFDIRDLIDECISIHINDANSKALDLISITDSELPSLIVGDANRIGQVINNLINNAIKFTSKGSIVVNANLVNHSKPELLISVSDSGIGIATEDQSRLFQPFSQLEAGLSRQTGGTGLGLAIVKSLVELMQGTVKLNSEPDKGSCFSFTLPLQRGANASHEHTDDNLYANYHAFVVSPNKQLTTSMRELLVYFKFTVSNYTNLADYQLTIQSAKNESSSMNIIFMDSLVPASDLDAIVSTAESIHAQIVMIQRDQIISDPLTVERFSAVLAYPPRAKHLSELLAKLIPGVAANNIARDSKLKAQLVKLNANRAFHVLVADDNAVNRQYLSTWLSQIGAVVDEVADGHEAIEMALRVKYDLILMDLHMPGLDGIEAANNIRNNSHLKKQPPIIAITADATSDAKQAMMDSAIDDILIKPVGEQDLIRAITNWCPDFFQSQYTAINPSPSTATLTPVDSIVDKETGLRLASGNEQLWRKSLTILQQRLTEQAQLIKQSIDEGNFTQLRDVSHSIAGAAAYVGALALHTTVKQLEHAAIESDINKINVACGSFFTAVENYLNWVSENIK